MVDYGSVENVYRSRYDWDSTPHSGDVICTVIPIRKARQTMNRAAAFRESIAPKRTLMIAFRPAPIMSSWLCLLLISGCSHMSRDECLTMNWHTAGVADAAEGAPKSRVVQYSQVCSKYSAKVDRTLYAQGYQEGIAHYCTKANGFEVAQNGDEYSDVCPANLESDFLSGWSAGHEFWTARDKVRSAEKIRITAVVKMLGPEVRDDRLSRDIMYLQTSRKQRENVLDGMAGAHFGTGIGRWEYELAAFISDIDKLIHECIEVKAKVAALGFDVVDACN